MNTHNGYAPSNTTDCLHGAFLGLLPKVERHAKLYFRDVKCPATREDRVARRSLL